MPGYPGMNGLLYPYFDMKNVTPLIFIILSLMTSEDISQEDTEGCSSTPFPQ